MDLLLKYLISEQTKLFNYWMEKFLKAKQSLQEIMNKLIVSFYFDFLFIESIKFSNPIKITIDRQK